MNRENLQQYLTSDTARLYCILDGASVPDLPVKLYDTGPANYCLLPGELDPELVYAAPYLVHLSPENSFTEWVLSESPGNHWGIFVHSAASMVEMRRHFRGLISVYDEAGSPLMFRYYDPRVLSKFLPTCEPEELTTFFGRAEALFAETDDGGMTRFEIENAGLKQTVLE